jgi:hypothetical protein
LSPSEDRLVARIDELAIMRFSARTDAMRRQGGDNISYNYINDELCD